MDSKCTLLLNSYDGGEDLWDGFFKALSIQWPDMNMKVVLNTETKKYSYSGFSIETFAPCKDKKMTWSQRLVYILKQIKTEYVLLFLDDFWLDQKVDSIFFNKTVQWMDDNKDVANFSYYPCQPGTNIDDRRFDRFELRPQKCEYKFNCQVGLWRTHELVEFLRPHEDPWAWEVYGSIRARRCKKLFYCLKESSVKVFSYGDNITGCIIHRGKWVKDAVIPLAERYGLVIDYSRRGFEDFNYIQEWKKMKRIQKILRINPVRFLCTKIRQFRTYWLSVRIIKNE